MVLVVVHEEPHKLPEGGWSVRTVVKITNQDRLGQSEETLDEGRPAGRYQGDRGQLIRTAVTNDQVGQRTRCVSSQLRCLMTERVMKAYYFGLSVLALSALVIGLAHGATPLNPVPLPQKGSCSLGYVSDSRTCTPSSGAKFAIPKWPAGSCPSNYASEGAYCVAQWNARYAFAKSSPSCPSGCQPDGDFCVSDR
jgi:hypothetical protein